MTTGTHSHWAARAVAIAGCSWLVAACPPEVHLSWADSASPRPHDYWLSMASFQRRLDSHYREGRRPPFMEAFFLWRLPRDRKEALFAAGCGPALVLANLLVAEFRIGTLPTEADAPFLEASDLVERLPPEQRQALEMEPSEWPVVMALQQVRRAEATLVPWKLNVAPGLNPGRLTLNFVVAHCRESLDWLVSGEFLVPPGTSVLVYEKCGQTADLSRVSRRFTGGVQTIPRPDQGGTRGDECSAYLTHITRHYEDLADFTVFLQSDPAEHLHFSFLNSVMESVASGVYNVPFLQLNGPRHVRTLTPCIQDVHYEILGYNLTALIGPYCCAQFITSKDMLRSHNLDFYERMLPMVDGTPGVKDICGIEGAKRSSHCYGFEFLWHIIFGQEPEPPLREDDASLPLFLRVKHGNEHVRTSWHDSPMARDMPLNHNVGPLS